MPPDDELRTALPDSWREILTRLHRQGRISVEDSEIPVHKDYVRLIHAAGEWRLHSLDNNSTEVTYIWNGDLLGDFPDWALTRAWETQGQEVHKWLKDAVE